MDTTIGVDVGTTGCKVAVVSREGEVLATTQASYPLLTPEPGAAELDPSAVWAAVCSAVKAACAAPGIGEPPSTLAVTTAGEALVPLDAGGHPIHNVVTSIDTRSVEVFRRSLAEHGARRFQTASGLAPLPHYTVFRWRWFAETRPELYARTVTLAGYADWLSAQFGSEVVTDRSLAVRSLAYRLDHEAWDEELVSLMGLDAARLPRVVSAGASVGLVRPEVASDLGLQAGARIVIAGLDQACAAFALDLPGPEVAMLSIGTTAVLGIEFADGAVAQPEVESGGIPVIPHVREGRQLALAGTPAGGAALRWFETRVLEQAAAPAARLEGLQDHRTDVLALPHLGGSRVAFSDPDAAGAILGLRFASDQRDITRALLDGVAYEVAVMLQRLRDLGFNVARLRAVGGGSRSAPWLQIMADVIGLPIDTTATSHGAAIGAAAIAQCATGGPLRDAGLPVQETFRPRPDWREHHAVRLRRFNAAYAALATERGSSMSRTPEGAS